MKGSTSLECRPRSLAFRPVLLNRKGILPKWCGGQGGGVSPGSQGKRMRTKRSGHPVLHPSVDGPPSLRGPTALTARWGSWGRARRLFGQSPDSTAAHSPTWQQRGHPVSALPVASTTRSAPCVLPIAPALPRPLPGVASALHFSLLNLTTFPRCSRCVLMWLSYPQPSQLSSFLDCETLISWFPMRLPSQGSLSSPRHEAVH